MGKARNPDPTKKKSSKQRRGLLRDPFIKQLESILKPKKPHKPEEPPRRRQAPPQVSPRQPAEGTRNLAGTSPFSITNIPYSSPRFVRAPWVEAPQSPPVDCQLPSLPAHDSFITDTSLPVSESIEYHAQGPAPGPSVNMYSDNLDDHGSQPYRSIQDTFDIDFEALNSLTFTNSPPAGVWGTQDQHAMSPSFAQAPGMTTAPAQPTREQLSEPQLDLASIQCQSIKIQGPGLYWTYLNAVFDKTSPHSFLRSSSANKAGIYGFTPLAPGRNHQSSTRYGLVTPTEFVNASIAGDGFFCFPQRRDYFYIFPDDQYCPANVDVIIGRNLWQAVFHQAEAEASAPHGAQMQSLVHTFPYQLS